GGAVEETGPPAGPPLSQGEREALRVAVQECWVVDVGSAAAQVTVTLAMRMTPQGKVEGDSLRLIASEGGDSRAAEVAFQAARRAVLRCQSQGRDGYDLPPEKYEHWRDIEMTFNPERMANR
ncbi:MAG TPA: cell envelope biogenesis protein TolA, partial [Rhodobacteraceae bacterium]|nr:cell envelope biogenesis protein TolA [Paracoccaceae bacterium]